MITDFAREFVADLRAMGKVYGTRRYVEAVDALADHLCRWHSGPTRSESFMPVAVHATDAGIAIHFDSFDVVLDQNGKYFIRECSSR